MHVLTLVADGLIQSALPAEARAWIESKGSLSEASWLHPQNALDLVFDASSIQEDLPELEDFCRSRQVDAALQPLLGRRKSLLVADMESTVIHNEMLDELADFVGAREQVAAITARAMNGELDFEQAIEERVSLLAGLSTEDLVTSSERIRIDTGAPVLIKTLKAHGVFTALVSGGFKFFAEPIRQQLGFDAMQANELLMESGRLTGEVRRPILDREAKVRALDRFCDDLGIGPEAAVTVGDGANDLSMLLKSGLGIAYHGKQHVAEAAEFRIDHGDLSALLYFQGYPHSQWVA